MQRIKQVKENIIQFPLEVNFTDSEMKLWTIRLWLEDWYDIKNRRLLWINTAQQWITERYKRISLKEKENLMQNLTEYLSTYSTINAVEIKDETNCGVLIYNNWP